MSQYIGIVIPLLLHLGISETVAAVFGDKLDAAARTLLVSLLVIPWAAWMYHNDKRMTTDTNRWQKLPGKSQMEGMLRRQKITEKDQMAETGSKQKMTGKNQTVEAGSDQKMSGKNQTAEAELQKRMPQKNQMADRIRRGLFSLILGGLLNLVWSRLLIRLQIQQQFSNAAQESLFAGQMAVQLLSMGLFVPLAEELVFRGLIYRRMRRMLPYGQAVVLASALFAVYHGNMIQMIFAFPMAIVICILYEKWESLRYPVLFHMGCNLAAILLNSL